jgi:formate dehydrogenase subunit delta
MNAESLVQMANAIAQFFDSMPDRQQAVDGVADHLQRYWEPRMREELLALAERGETGAIHPLAAEALRIRGASLVPTQRPA